MCDLFLILYIFCLFAMIIANGPTRIPSVIPTVNPNTEVEVDEGAASEEGNNLSNWETWGTVVLIGTFILPCLIGIGSSIYHKQSRYNGCDKPNYIAIFDTFFHIGDFGSDLIFAMLLNFENHYLVYVQY